MTPCRSAAVAVLVLPLCACQDFSIHLGGARVKMETVEETARTLLRERTGQAPASIDCPDSVPAEKGRTFECAAHMPDGTAIAVVVDQTSDDGKLYLNLKDPRALAAFTPIADTFFAAYDASDPAGAFALFGQAGLHAPGFREPMECRRAVNGPSRDRRVASAFFAPAGPPGSRRTGSLELDVAFASGRLPVRLDLEHDGRAWRVTYVNLPLRRDLEVPPQAELERIARSFLADYDQGRLESGPHAITGALPPAAARGLQRVRRIAGPLRRADVKGLRSTPASPAVLDFALDLERSPAALALTLTPCGSAWKVSGVQIDLQPAAALRVARAELAQMVADELQPRSPLALKASCPGAATLALEAGSVFECDVTDGRVRGTATVSVKDRRGGVHIEMRPAGASPPRAARGSR